MAQIMDSMFGTRYHTPGAELQLPRKVPMRVEPKSFFGEPPAAEQQAWSILVCTEELLIEIRAAGWPWALACAAVSDPAASAAASSSILCRTAWPAALYNTTP
jgi:hypothetical protein